MLTIYSKGEYMTHKSPPSVALPSKRQMVLSQMQYATVTFDVPKEMAVGLKRLVGHAMSPLTVEGDGHHQIATTLLQHNYSLAVKTRNLAK